MVPNVTFLILNGVVGHKFRTLPRFLGNISKLKTLDMLKRCNILFFACPGFSSASSLLSSASLSPASWSRYDNSNFLNEKSCSNFCPPRLTQMVGSRHSSMLHSLQLPSSMSMLQFSKYAQSKPSWTYFFHPVCKYHLFRVESWVLLASSLLLTWGQSLLDRFAETYIFIIFDTFGHPWYILQAVGGIFASGTNVVVLAMGASATDAAFFCFVIR